MKVILLENLSRIGSIGQMIEVKTGFAINSLISNKKALYASKENIVEVEKIKIELGKKDSQKKQEAQKVSEQISGKEYLIEKLSTENKELYGSVKPTEIAKLSIFQPNKYKFKKTCPLSAKGAPEVDYKNIRLLKKYMSENGKILPSRITNVSQKKQRELSLSIKRARNLALI